MWQQNHCGVYRSDDRGDDWERLEGNGLPSGFGFPLALHPREPDAAYVIPEEGAENRVTPDGRLGVYRTADGGATWELLQNGLPQQAWAAVMREGFASDRLDPAGIYFGTCSSVFVVPQRGRRVGRGRQLRRRSCRSSRGVVVVRLPSLVAEQAGGQREFVEGSTLGEALRALPIADLLLDERASSAGLSTSTSTARMLAWPTVSRRRSPVCMRSSVIAAVAGGR